MTTPAPKRNDFAAKPSWPRIAGLVVADLFGMFCTFVGAGWFIFGSRGPFPGFPNSLAEAAAALAGGIAVMTWAAYRLLNELGKQKGRR